MLNHARKLFAASILTAALAVPMSAQPQQGGQMGGMERKQGQGREGHPEIREAIRHLEAARNILVNKAAHDFGGHRQQAIESVDQALKHLHEALEYDKK